MENLYFVGPMGSGKTTVGRLVAERLGRPFADTDALIIERAGCSIPEIFARDGEEGFRRLEAAVLRELPGGLVVATGGGLVLRPENRDHLKATGCTVWLRVPAEELYRRLAQGEGVKRRPLLQGEDPLGKLRAIATAREPLYRQAADIIVETGGLTPQEAAEAVLRRLEARGRDCKGTH